MADLALEGGSQQVHPVDQKLPGGRLAALGMQHVLVMYAGAIAVPLIVGRALGLTPEQVALLISADLFCCGLVTLIQSLGFGKYFGIKLPVMMGVTFAAVGPMVAMANVQGGPEGARAIFGAIIGAGILSIFIAPFMSRLLRFFPPVVTGTIIAIIGISGRFPRSPDLDTFWDDVAAAYRVAIGHLAAAGCRYLQLDDITFAYLCDPKIRDNCRANGDDPAALPHTYARVIDELGATLPGLAMAARTVGSPQIRNRGTVGGSVALGEPAAEMPATAVALGAVIATRKSEEVAGHPRAVQRVT